LNRIEEAFEIADHLPDSKEKFRRIGDICLMTGDFDLGEKSLFKAQDYNSLFLLYSCENNEEKLR